MPADGWTQMDPWHLRFGGFTITKAGNEHPQYCLWHGTERIAGPYETAAEAKAVHQQLAREAA